MKALLRIYLPILLLMCSCTVDVGEEDWTDPTQKGGEKVGITLRMPVAGESTRALTEEDENEVTAVDILIFRPSDQQFVELISTDDIEDDAIYHNLKTFYVRLQGETTIDLVVLGNARDILREAFPTDEDMKGLYREEILSKLILLYEGPWVDNQGKMTRPFPMWGFRYNVEVKEDAFKGEENAIRMTRMVIRVDVHVMDTAQDDFKLNEVYLYNSSLKGKLVHSMTQGWDATEGKATEPDLPLDVPTKWRVDYKGAPSAITTPDISSERVVYTLEAPAGSEEKLLETTALVVGGIYDNEQYYYRVDFMEKDKEGKSRFIPLVRNHHYEINIHEVLGKGYKDPDDAFRKGMTNMELDIVAWNEAGMGDITFGAQYQLVVNTDSFYFYSNGREQTLKIYTDHPDGWIIERVEENPGDLDWLNIDPEIGPEGTTTDVKISAEELALPDDDRMGEFYIRAGNLRKKIKVYQSLEAELYLEINPNLIVFRKSSTISKSVTITVDPGSRPVYVSWAGSPDLVWQVFPTTGAVGQTEYIFKPQVNETGNLLSGVVTFMISDDAGNSTTRTLSILQLPTDSRFDIQYQYSPVYPALGGDNLWMRFSSETSWQIIQDNIKMNELMTNILIPHDNYVEHESGDYLYYFRLETNPYFEERTINLLVTSDDPDFEPVTVPVVQDYTRPKLEILSPTGGNISFTTMEPVDVTFRVNTDWCFSTKNDYDDIIRQAIYDSNNITPLEVKTGGTIHNPEEFTVNFIPHVYKEAIGTPAGGTVHNATITFSTTNHSPADASLANINISQEIPYFFDEEYFKVRKGTPDGELLMQGDTIPRETYTLYIESRDNTTWIFRGRHIRNGKEIDHSSNVLITKPAAPWDEYSMSMEFPSTQSWYTDSLKLSFIAAYKTVNGKVVNVANDVTTPEYMLIHKAEFYIDKIELDPRLEDPAYIIPAEGASFTIKITGKFPAIDEGNYGSLGIMMCAETENPEGLDYNMGYWYVPGSNGQTVSHTINIGSNSMGSTIKEYGFYITVRDDNKNWLTKKWEHLVTKQQDYGRSN